MKCIYCRREFDELEAYNKEMREHFEFLGMNCYVDVQSIPEEVDEVQCECGSWNQLDDKIND